MKKTIILSLVFLFLGGIIALSLTINKAAPTCILVVLGWACVCKVTESITKWLTK